jgi:hypothetical protein
MERWASGFIANMNSCYSKIELSGRIREGLGSEIMLAYVKKTIMIGIVIPLGCIKRSIATRIVYEPHPLAL